MKTYRSSTLRLFSRHCPHALALHEQGAPQDRSIFEVGVAAHDCLEAIGHACKRAGRVLEQPEADEVAHEAFRALISTGRDFEGTPEPPLSPDAAAEGRDLATRWYARNGLSASAEYEVRLTLPDGRYKARVDALEVVDEVAEEWSARVLVIDEYKTAWPTNAGELDTIQTRGHVVLGALAYPDVDVIRRRVHNLRTLGTFEHEVDMHDPETPALLARWEADLRAMCDAADSTREPRPGIGCAGCMYATVCEHSFPTADNPLEMWASAEIIREAFAPLARAAAAEDACLVQHGQIGYLAKEASKPVERAHVLLAQHWHSVHDDDLPAWEAEHAAWLGLLQAMQIGKTNIDKAIKALYPGRDGRDARNDALGVLLETVIETRFGWTRKPQDFDATIERLRQAMAEEVEG